MAFFSPLMADTSAMIQNTNKAIIQAIMAKLINHPKKGINTKITFESDKQKPVKKIPSACLK